MIAFDEAQADDLELARAAAAHCGVTRLAELTGLDRVGVPVFHAVRPASRALVTHQGKGLTRRQAQIGALMEAVESAHAEAFEERSLTAALQALPAARRLHELADVCRERTDVVGHDEPLDWTEAKRLVDGGPLYVPFDTVSLDCERPWDRRLDHTSNGLAARFDEAAAVRTALLEVLERDAAAAWRALAPDARTLQTLARSTIPYDWFHDIEARLREARMRLTLHSRPSLIGLPVVRAEVLSPEAPGPNAQTVGWACATTAEAALRGAVLEAVQCRLTGISGARDDILHGRPAASMISDAVPLPPHLDALDWQAIAAGDDEGMTAWRIADRLAAAGYPDAAAVRVSPPGGCAAVVKVFAPGLGANRRTRRPPIRERSQ